MSLPKISKRPFLDIGLLEVNPNTFHGDSRYSGLFLAFFISNNLLWTSLGIQLLSINQKYN